MNGARWTPGIGDPTIMGWVTVVAYFAAAVLCFRTARRNPDARRIWWALTTFLVLLGINKQLDLQSWFTQEGRDLARGEGWYDSRAAVQRAFIAAIVGLGLTVSGLSFWATLRRPATVRVAVAGLAVLLAFIAIRAASFHHVDLFLGSTLLGVRFNWLLELGGIAIIGAAAGRYR